MKIGHENGFVTGNDRYGSRQNAVKYMCAGCGREYGPGQGNMGRCPSCGGTLQLMGPDSRDNADACGNCHHSQGMHDKECSIDDCSCQKFVRS